MIWARFVFGTGRQVQVQLNVIVNDHVHGSVNARVDDNDVGFPDTL